MAKLVSKIVFHPLDNHVDKIVNKIKDIAEKSDDVKQKASLYIARDVVNNIAKRYRDEYLPKIANFEHGFEPISYSITDTKKGYVVHVTGKDLLYQEYGTGTRGLQNKHPRHDADGMKPYGSGRFIIHNDRYLAHDELPYWYKLLRDFPTGIDSEGNPIRGIPRTDFGNERLKASDYVWKHNGIVTKGLPAGRFIYDTCREYTKDGALGDKKRLKKTITQVISKDLSDKISREIVRKEESRR